MEALRCAPFFQELHDELLRAAVRAGEVRLVRLGRDKLLDLRERVLFLLAGQVTVAEIDRQILARERLAQSALAAGDLQAEKREYVRRLGLGPTMRLCENNLASFGESRSSSG